MLLHILLGLSVIAIIIIIVVSVKYTNNMKKLCTPIENSDRIIISNLECISVIFEFLYINKDLETDIIKVFMDIFNPSVAPNKENFYKYMTNLMSIMNYNFSTYYNLSYVNIQEYLSGNYENITDNCELYLLLGKYRFLNDFLNKITVVMKNKKIVDTTNQFLLKDLLNIYLYYKLINCQLNKNMLNTTTIDKVLFENSVLYKMFTCFKDL